MRFLDRRRVRIVAALVMAVAVVAPWQAPADADAGGIVSDSFDGALNTSRWTFVNPLNDAGVAVANGHADLSVPAGTEHNLYTNDLSAPWLRQVAPNTDFEVEAKFDSVPAARFHMQGIIVEQSAGNLIRYDAYHDGTTARLFAATFTNGKAKNRVDVAVTGAPSYLRVARTGNTFALRYSYDGSSWQTAVTFSFAMTVAGVGPFVGNAGSPAPAFTASVDHFNLVGSTPPPGDTTPPVISNVAVAPSATGATVTWNTNEAASSRVDYGTTSGLGANVSSGSLVTSHSVALPSLTCETTYHYRVTSVDAATNSASTTTATFQTSACSPGDTTPPVISNVAVAPSATGATVTWNTNEAASSRVDYGTTSGLGANVSSGSLVTSHSVALPSLTCETTYHYRVTSVDAATNSASNSIATFETSTCPPPPTGLTTDQFDGSSLNTSLWTFVDPRGDSSVGVGFGHAAITAPATVTHDLWKNQIHAPWIRQAAPNADFEVEAKFSSTVETRYQIQGLIVEQNATNLIRFDVHHDGTNVRVFGATIAGSTAKQRFSMPVTGMPSYLRIQRAGNVWTMRYSYNGTTWLTAATFTYAMTVSGIGPYSGNAGSPVPAHTANVDYFANVGEAPPPPPPDDTTPPVISSIAAAPGSSSATVTWTTNEPATSRVDYGTTPSFGNNVTNASLQQSHSLLLLGLACETQYHYQVSSADAAENATTSTTRTFTTGSCGDIIDVWYGATQHFGARGRPQKWVNVLGNVSGSVSSLTYRLNGGPSVALSIGPDAKRLNRPGDFNVELDYDALQTGNNTVQIAAVPTGGTATSETVTVVKHVVAAPSLPSTTDFASSSNPNDVVQVVDGNWITQGNNLRIAEMGYDRLAVIGDLSWQDYEVTMPVIVHGLSPDAYAPQHGSPVVGIAMRWQGHSQFDPGDPSQPAWWWYPTGAFAWFKYPETNSQRLELTGNENAPIVRKVGLSMPFGVQHLIKVRVETVSGGTQYSAKWWAAGQAEPSWMLTMTDTGPASGSVGLLVHDLDASIANVTVTPI